MRGSLKVTAENSMHATTAPYLCPHKALLLHMYLLVFVTLKHTLMGNALSGAFSNAKVLA